MKLLTLAIVFYILGLFTFYLFATFEGYYWPLLYYGWAKVCDCGILFWGVLYECGNTQVKKIVKWLYVFSFIRLIADLQGFFTGVGVNNEPAIAALFLGLICVTAYLSLKPESRISNWLSKHLFKDT